MKCDFNYCIYNEAFVCILNEVKINSIGQCEECIIISVSPQNIDECKKKQRKEM